MVVLGNILQRLFNLRYELYQYLTEENHGSADMFNNSDLITKLAHLSDTFEKLNALNIYLQGGDSNINELSDKLKSFL
jgi:hypothetical protein